MKIKNLDQKLLALLRRSFLPVSRLAIFVVYFWFGILKLLDLSPAGPLAQALAAKTIGAEHFMLSFKVLAVYECLIAVLFLIPRFTRVVIPLLLVHLVIVCSPLLLVPEL